MEKLTQQNIQEAFLNNARKDKTFLTIYLMSGVKLSGRIKSFDKYSVILEASNQEQLIFKHAISTVVISKSAHSPMGRIPGRVSGTCAADASSNRRHKPGVAQPIGLQQRCERAILVGLDLKGRASRTGSPKVGDPDVIRRVDRGTGCSCRRARALRSSTACCNRERRRRRRRSSAPARSKNSRPRSRPPLSTLSSSIAI